MATLERNGEVLHYHVSGSGSPILLGHSLLCGPWMWNEIATDLARRFTVINVEFRGHGASSANRRFTLDDLAEDWLAVLDHLGFEKAILCGLSMGGMTAMRVALSAPERVTAMILLNTSADPEALRKKLEYAILTRLYARWGFNQFLLKMVAPIMLGKTTRRTRPELTSLLAERVRQHQPPAMIKAIQAVVTRDDILPRLHTIGCPTRILTGEEDVATPVFRSERMQQRISGSELVRLPNLGHLSALESPQRVNREITAFLARLG